MTCGFCNKSFSSGLTPKILKSGLVKYYLYKCETDGCGFKGKSVRAKVILDFAEEFLSTHLFTTQSNYGHFVKEAKAEQGIRTQQLNSDIMSLTKLVG